MDEPPPFSDMLRTLIKESGWRTSMKAGKTVFINKKDEEFESKEAVIRAYNEAKKESAARECNDSVPPVGQRENNVSITSLQQF